jgi:hypothetical protein
LSLAASHSWIGIKPDVTKTPGVMRPEITREAVCSTKWGKDRRHVTEAMKRQVAHAYGLRDDEWADYEFDHLISRENGGADSVLNLWPQPRFGDWNAAKKDQLENQLHRFVCDGSMELDVAQHWLATDWITAYQRFMRNGGRHHRRGITTGRYGRSGHRSR